MQKNSKITNNKKLYLNIHIKPNSKNNKIETWHNQRLKISLKAPAIEGKANAALISYLSEVLKIPKSEIEIIKGETSKLKTISLPAHIESQLKNLYQLPAKKRLSDK